MTNGSHPEAGGGAKPQAEKPVQGREQKDDAKTSKEGAPAESRQAGERRQS